MRARPEVDTVSLTGSDLARAALLGGGLLVIGGVWRAFPPPSAMDALGASLLVAGWLVWLAARLRLTPMMLLALMAAVGCLGWRIDARLDADQRLAASLRQRLEERFGDVRPEVLDDRVERLVLDRDADGPAEPAGSTRELRARVDRIESRIEVWERDLIAELDEDIDARGRPLRFPYARLVKTFAPAEAAGLSDVLWVEVFERAVARFETHLAGLRRLEDDELAARGVVLLELRLAGSDDPTLAGRAREAFAELIRRTGDDRAKATTAALWRQCAELADGSMAGAGAPLLPTRCRLSERFGDVRPEVLDYRVARLLLDRKDAGGQSEPARSQRQLWAQVDRIESGIESWMRDLMAALDEDLGARRRPLRFPYARLVKAFAALEAAGLAESLWIEVFERAVARFETRLCRAGWLQDEELEERGAVLLELQLAGSLDPTLAGRALEAFAELGRRAGDDRAKAATAAFWRRRVEQPEDWMAGVGAPPLPTGWQTFQMRRSKVRLHWTDAVMHAQALLRDERDTLPEPLLMEADNAFRAARETTMCGEPWDRFDSSRALLYELAWRLEVREPPEPEHECEHEHEHEHSSPSDRKASWIAYRRRQLAEVRPWLLAAARRVATDEQLDRAGVTEPLLRRVLARAR